MRVLTVPLLIGMALLLSACLTNHDGPRPVYGYGVPYGSLDLAGWR
jgi:hypothetical protein